ncbi:MAG TPA: SMC family ATPase [Gemmatimonadales bacterium]|nr:SMC family ATPase [Gemmatimonadales bacterium]
MEIRRLRLVNFRQHAETVIEFERGLTGIIGPNGAGKTTLLEAIAWAIYGSDAARGTKETIRRRGAPPRSRVEVELDFDLGSHRYRVLRGLSQAQLFQDSEPAPIANSVVAVTERLNRLIGMTRQEFFNTYFTGQKELAIMAQMSAPERAQFLSRVLGYERLRIAQQRLKDRRRVTQATLDARRSELSDPARLAVDQELATTRVGLAEATAAAGAEALQRAAAALETLRPDAARWEALQREILSLEGDVKVARHAGEAARQQFSRFDRELAEALDARGRLDRLAPELAPFEGLRAERERLEAERGAAEGRRSMEARLAEMGRQVERLEQRLAQIPAPEALAAAAAAKAAGLQELDRVKAEAEAARSGWDRERQDAETQRRTLLGQHEDLVAQRKRLEAAGPGGDCPTCSRPLGDEYRSVMALLGRQMEEVSQQGKYYRKRIKELQAVPPALVQLVAREAELDSEVRAHTAQVARLEELRTERARLETELALLAAQRKDLTEAIAASPARYDETRLSEVRSRIATLEPLAQQALQLQVVAARAEELAPARAAAAEELARWEARARELGDRLAGSGWSEESFAAARDRLGEAERAVQQAEVAQARAAAEVNAARAHRAEVLRRIEERERRAALVERLTDEVLLIHELDRALGDLRTELNNALRPDLSDLASQFLRDLTGGRYTDLELDEDYLATIVEDGEPKRVISGGEEDVANLALRLAISQMIAERAGQPLSLLVLDEIFGSLDEDRRAAVVDLLRNLADRFPQVILITHIESVREGFDRVIRLTYDVERRVARAVPESRDAAA